MTHSKNDAATMDGQARRAPGLLLDRVVVGDDGVLVAPVDGEEQFLPWRMIISVRIQRSALGAWLSAYVTLSLRAGGHYMLRVLAPVALVRLEEGWAKEQARAKHVAPAGFRERRGRGPLVYAVSLEGTLADPSAEPSDRVAAARLLAARGDAGVLGEIRRVARQAANRDLAEALRAVITEATQRAA